MKKKLIALVAGALMTLSASSAFAAFADLHLIRVYYDRAGNEYGTDLGLVSDLTAKGAQTRVDGTFGSLNLGTSYAVYFALDRVNNDLWASGSTTVPSGIIGGSTGLTGLKNGSTNMYATYGGAAATTYVGPASATNSYMKKLSPTGQQGALAGAINTTTRANTEMSLANLATTNTQTLYYWSNGLTTVAADKIGVFAASIVTNSDGSSTVTGAPVPIPAAAYLLGSGLLGLVGIRRKMNK